ncbi:ABC transporter ATP-binding protein [Cumulibacter soli]|uniref:ABC transporter ATP-binding protein n=1 Tax=Cumulibacter soli TaxID=2546344 RepID=UPI0010681980|nr:ABC transporter ATP-binding protein [Cumulibacter soli]
MKTTAQQTSHSRSASGVADSDVLVDISGLTKSYGGRVVVDHLDLQVRRGEVLGLIGANGAGKTTTVEIIQGLRRADSGRISVFGMDPIKDADRIRPHIGSQLQSSALPDRMRVGEAVRLFADTGAADANQLLEEFGLAHRVKYAFGGMSGGEQQRLFLVLALLNRPRLVILDELTQGLDPSARRNVWEAVKRLRTGGTTVLLVTHELGEAEELCERVVAMRDGTVLAEGSPADLLARFSDAATVSFTWRRDGDTALARDLNDLNGLPGLSGVRREDDRIFLRGDAELVAHAGAWLVATGAQIPHDLRVDRPGLEDALLTLLDQPAHTDLQGAA